MYEFYCMNFILLGQLKLHSQNKPVLALLIHAIPLRNIVEPLIVSSCSCQTYDGIWEQQVDC